MCATLPISMIKIIARAEQQGIDPKSLAEHYIQEFEVDMKALGVLTPDVEPKATGHILEIIGLVQKLIDQGVGYVIEGDVYFAVEKFPSYRGPFQPNFGRDAGRSQDRSGSP